MQALQNKAFEANIPLIDISFKKIFSFAKSFNNRLFEFFVKVEEFEKRGVKSLKIEQSDKNVTAINASDIFELYVITEDLNANPIAGNAQVLRDQASKCTITFNSYEGFSNHIAWIEDIIDNTVSLYENVILSWTLYSGCR